MKFFKYFVLVFMFVVVSFQAFADEGPTNIDEVTGYAIQGFDTVSYFTEGKAIKGSQEFSYNWNHAIWLFSSAENLALFELDPSKYAPQYGGYCAWAASRGRFAPIEAEQFAVVNGKLYLNYNAKISTRWNKKRDFYIERADKKWPELLKEVLKNVSD